MRYYILFLSFALNGVCAFGQNNANEAKAAYLLAEESYSKGDMKSAIEFLGDASAKLGGANSKILYLKIMAQRELANKDTSYLSKLASSISIFEKAPDAKDFSEEKSLEIMKIKLQLNKELAQKNKAEQNKTVIEEGLKAFALEHPDWPLGATLDELKAKHPDVFAPVKKQPGYVITPGELGTAYTFIKGTSYNTTPVTTNIYIKDGRLVGYTQRLFLIANDDGTHAKGKEVLKASLERLTTLTNIQPVTTPANITNGESTTYSWKAGENFLTITNYFSLFSGAGLSSIDLFFYHPNN